MNCLLGFFLFFQAIFVFARAEVTVVAMAPLQISDFQSPDSSPQAWEEFGRQLEFAKEAGVEAITMDVWWGAVETSMGVYNWAYYDKAFQMIREAGLKWVPILSFHKLGGNVGDQGDQPIPAFPFEIRNLSQGQGQFGPPMELSEGQNWNGEALSPLATPQMKTHYQRFMSEFQNHYAEFARYIQEINISLGRSGELRNPSYNGHDPFGNWWDRGRLQIYSPGWQWHFQQYVLNKYGSLSEINKAWGSSLRLISQIRAPDDPDGFFTRGDQFSQYGMDLFDFQNQALVNHAKLMFEQAYYVFDNKNSAFSGIDLGAKLPGIHWRMATDRLAELSAGLIRTSYGEDNWKTAEAGYGYLHTLKAFQEISEMANNSKFILHFTALEMNDMPDGHLTGSKAKTLVYWIAEVARSLGLTIKGENALGYELENEEAWLNIQNAILHAGYDGFTALRLDEIYASENKRRGLIGLNRWIDQNRCALSVR